MKRKKILFLMLALSLLVSCKNSVVQDDQAQQKGGSGNPLLREANYNMIADLQGKLHSVAQNKSSSVVFISIEKIVKYNNNNPFSFNDPFDFFNQQRPDGQNQNNEREYKQQGLGSGVIYKKKGNAYYIITNNHVVAGADTIQITIDNDKVYEGEVMGTDPQIDIAVVKIETKDDLQVAQVGDSGNLIVGDFVIAIGNPYGLSHSMTFGIISALGRENIASDRSMLTNFIQTDAAINPGNSGGPLLNIDGQVIGINTMIYSQSGGSVGIGFAIPVNIAKNVAEQIITTGKVEHGWLGVYFQPLTDEAIETLGIKKTKHGMLVSQVVEGGPADKAGLKTGDVLISLNGKDLKKSGDLTLQIGNAAPGTKAVFKVLRDGKTREISVVLGDRAKLTADLTGEKEDEKGSDESVTLSDYGLQVAGITGRDRSTYDIPESIKGAVITAVQQGSIAAQYQLKKGDVIVKINRTPISSPQDITKILKKSSGNAYWFIYRRGSQIIIRM